MRHALARPTSATSLVHRLVELPDLPRTVRALPAPAFAALVRRVGIEDAPEIVACATTEQLVAAFDEDLFTGDRGERATLDGGRFARWLEALRDAGDERAARRLTELSEGFVTHALDALLLVLDLDALRDRMSEDDDDAADRADKALESTLSEEIDGYLLVARDPDAWDTVLAIVLALDRDHRGWLERVLDRLAALSRSLLDDLDELTTALSEAASLAEDVEAERDERRSAAGFVEARAARAFLRLARSPETDDARDAHTRAYFRGLSRTPLAQGGPDAAEVMAWLAEAEASETPRRRRPRARRLGSGEGPPVAEALRLLGQRAPDVLETRMEELAYLANVLVAAGRGPHGAFRALEAAEAALATVALGVALVVGEGDVEAWARQLEREPADRSFRRASAALARRQIGVDGVLFDRAELPRAIAAITSARGSA